MSKNQHLTNLKIKHDMLEKELFECQKSVLNTDKIKLIKRKKLTIKDEIASFNIKT